MLYFASFKGSFKKSTPVNLERGQFKLQVNSEHSPRRLKWAVLVSEHWYPEINLDGIMHLQ